MMCERVHGRVISYGPKAYKRSEEHTSELQSQSNLVCRLLLEKKTSTLVRPAAPASHAMSASPHCTSASSPHSLTTHPHSLSALPSPASLHSHFSPPVYGLHSF